MTSDRSAYSNAVGAAAKVLRSLAVAVHTRAKKKRVPFPFAYTHIQVTHARATRARLTEKISTAEVSAEHTQTLPSLASRVPRISGRRDSRRRSRARAKRASFHSRFNSGSHLVDRLGARLAFLSSRLSQKCKTYFSFTESRSKLDQVSFHCLS